ILIVTDLEHYIIPDQIQLALIPPAIILNYLEHKSMLSMAGGALAALTIGIVLRYFIHMWKKQDPLGMGDIKFMAVSGLYLGINNLPIFFFIAGILGVLTAVIWGLLNKGKIFPFGPALAVSLFITLLIPNADQVLVNLIYSINSIIGKII